jgi:5'-methylthioadenosine phosphorylase
VIGFITGTGLYQLPGLLTPEASALDTPYGKVEVTVGTWHGQRVAFVRRHGADHTVAPSRINYRANIWALGDLGVRELYTAAVVGSLRPDYGPGSLVLLDQFIDLTKGRRADTFFDGEDDLRHVDVTYPYSESLRGVILSIARDAGVEIAPTGTYACFEGPRFESAAEAAMARTLGGDVVGMTAYPEVVLARELGMEVCTVALVSNYAPGTVGNTVSIQEVVAEADAASSRLFVLLGRAVEAAGGSRPGG